MVCDQTYTMELCRTRKIEFCGREYIIKYQDVCPKKIVIQDNEDKSTTVIFHEDVDCNGVNFSLDTWDMELLKIYIVH